MKKEKDLGIELMRAVACFFVIFNHTYTNGFFLFSLYDKNSLKFWLYLSISIFIKCAVPLFFMISGELLLDREEPLSKLWGKRIAWAALALCVWSFFYYCVAVWQKGTKGFSLKEFAAVFYDSNWNISFWYMYAYLAMLLMLPFLRRMVRETTDREFVYLFALYMFFSGARPVLEYRLWQGRHALTPNFELGWLCADIFIYPCLGYFLQKRRRGAYGKKEIAVLWLLNAAGILISCYMTWFQVNVTGVCREDSSQNFFCSFSMINALTVFVTCKYLAEKIGTRERVCRAVRSVGGCTFGIYMVHLFWLVKLEWMNRAWYVLRDDWHVNEMVTAFLMCTGVYALSYVTTLALKKLPVIRRLAG